MTLTIESISARIAEIDKELAEIAKENAIEVKPCGWRNGPEKCSWDCAVHGGWLHDRKSIDPESVCLFAEKDEKSNRARRLQNDRVQRPLCGEKRALLALRVLLIEGEAVAALHSESTLYVQPLLDDVRAAYEGETQ